MRKNDKRFPPLGQRGPLRVLFVITSMPVGGAETLLVNLVRRMDRDRFAPEICCLKELGPLGETLVDQLPMHDGLLQSKYDLRVLGRLKQLIIAREIDAVVTVGAGDKMFWGRLAGWRAGVPVVLSALHSTGWPDGVGRLNRWLTPITDRFIAVAQEHGSFLVREEGFPSHKVAVIPNGVDIERFAPHEEPRDRLRRQWGVRNEDPVFGIVAALRPEKNHLMFLRVAALVSRARNRARFVIVGDGPVREQLEVAIASARLEQHVHLLGTRADIPDLLAAMDSFLLTSHIEANPVSILEAMSTGLPVVATRVGSVGESVNQGESGFLVSPGDAETMARHCVRLADNRQLAKRLGRSGRKKVVECSSLESMVNGYESLIELIYHQKCGGQLHSAKPETASCPEATETPTPAVGSSAVGCSAASDPAEVGNLLSAPSQFNGDEGRQAAGAS